MSSLSKIKDLMSRIDEGYNEYRQLVTEGLSQLLYHFTSIRAAFNICNENTIYFQSAYAKEADNYDNKREFYLSCTRIFNSHVGYSNKFNFGEGGVRITLDGNKLAQRYKGKQVNYWGGGVFTDKYTYYNHLPKDYEDLKKRHDWDIIRLKGEKGGVDPSEEEIEQYLRYNFDRNAQTHTSNESEDRILSYEPLLSNASNYIISIDVLLLRYDEDERQQKIAYSFMRTPLRGKIKLFKSDKEFNKPNGQTINDEVLNQYFTDRYTGNDEYEKPNRHFDILKNVIMFIAMDDDAFEGKNFGASVANLLSKYGLGEYKSKIGDIKFEFDRAYFHNVRDSLYNNRRELSDKPDKITAKIVKMLTDYCLKLGANSFTDAISIKQQMIDDKWSQNNKPVYDRIDTSVKVPFIICNHYTLIVNPTKDLFRDVYNGNEEDLRSIANEIANEVMDENGGYYSNGKPYNTSSKNVNSMFQYIYKLLTRGSVQQVMDAFNKLGLTQEFLSGWNISFEIKELDYWAASNFDTVNTKKYMQANQNYNYRQVSKMRDKEIEQCFPRKNNGDNA